MVKYTDTDTQTALEPHTPPCYDHLKIICHNKLISYVWHVVILKCHLICICTYSVICTHFLQLHTSCIYHRVGMLSAYYMLSTSSLFVVKHG